MRAIYEILKDYFGYSSFRPNQEEIITSVIQGNDTLALLPTGGGKSICFQVPGLYLEGICIVVSPLISLMEDQVRSLNQKGIQASYIHSGMKYGEVQEILDKAQFGKLKFLYVSPERLDSKDFQQRSLDFPIDLIAIDESHCISQWGYDFRPSYLKIKHFLELHPKAKRMAVTATATPTVVEDILNQLQFKNTAIFKSSFERENLAYHTVEVQNKDNVLFQSLKKYSGSSIVYCATRKEVKRVCRMLQTQGFSADFYHGGLNTHTRKKKQDLWVNNERRVMVATNAFGMGIDKPDVRLVIHYDIPENIESYFQEAGRAGRDLQESLAVLLFEESDKTKLEERVQRKFVEEDQVRAVYEHLCNHLQITLDSGKDVSHELDLLQFSKKYELDLLLTYNAMQALENCGVILFNEVDNSKSKIRVVADREVVYQFQISQPAYDAFLRYLARSYPGIFDQYIEFRLEDFSRHLKTSYKRILEQLDYLHKHELIEYSIKSENSRVDFLQNRKKKKELDLRHYKSLQEVAFENLKQVKNYLNQENCRSLFLRNYFGDESQDKCGKCSFCKRQPKDIKESLLKLIQNGIELNELILQSRHDESQVLENLEELISEGKIRWSQQKFNFIEPV